MPPSHIDLSEMEDPIEFEKIQHGRVYGFIVIDDRWYSIGSLDFYREMQSKHFRGSNNSKLFVPLLNSLQPLQNIKWVQF